MPCIPMEGFWENLKQQDHKTMCSRKKGVSRNFNTIWCTNPFPPKMKNGTIKELASLGSGSTNEMTDDPFTFAVPVDLCQLKHSELLQHLSRKSCASVGKVKTTRDKAQCSPKKAHQLSRRQLFFLHTISRLPDMTGEAIDAVSAYTQANMSAAPSLLILPEKECQVWIRLPPSRRPTNFDTLAEPVVVLLERNPYGHGLAGPLWERRLEEVLLKQNGDMYLPGNFFTAIENHNCSCPYV